MKNLLCMTVYILMITIPQTLAQPANLVLENIVVSGTELFQATNSITAGPNFIVAATGTATLDAPSVTLRSMAFVLQGGKLYLLSENTTLDTDAEDGPLPAEYSLTQNYPNPFNSATVIKYSVPQRSKVVLKVYDILGNEIRTLVNEEKEEGIYTKNFDAGNLTSGVYLCRMAAGNFIDTKKIILLK
jgi:hypothetical protein